jgi:hypothetical protein
MVLKVSKYVLAYFVMMIIMLAGCDGSSNNKLVGKWEHKEPESGITVIVEFTSKQLSFSAEGVDPAKASYTYVDEDTIKVRNPATGVDVDTRYSIDGDKLSIAFNGEDTVEFTRVK